MATGPIKQVTNNSGSNYCKMPDGTLIQWGLVTFPAASATGRQLVSVPFPISYTSPPTVLISWRDNVGSLPSFFSGLSVGASEHAPTNTGFTAMAMRTDIRYSWDAAWIAIGRWK